MKGYKKIAVVLVLFALMFLLGSCSKMESRPVGVTAITEAAAPGIFSLEQGKDATSFLVGEFSSGSGTVTRFDGFGKIIIVQADGSEVVGSYRMSEYENRDAVVSITMNGTSTDYAFTLSGPDGSFTLTDKYENTYAFVPTFLGM